MGQASHARPREPRQRDQAIGLEARAVGLEQDPSLSGRAHVVAGVDLDAALGQQLVHRVTRAVAEESERRGGGRREAELHRTVAVGREGAGHERELVERERPHDAGRQQEGDAANAAVCDVVEELAVSGGAALVDEGQRVGKDRYSAAVGALMLAHRGAARCPLCGSTLPGLRQTFSGPVRDRCVRRLYCDGCNEDQAERTREVEYVRAALDLAGPAILGGPLWKGRGDRMQTL